MSQPAVALAPLPFELVLDDGEPLESEWHVLQILLLWALIRQAMAEQGRTDFYVGGNMFVYYSFEQARGVAEEMEKGLEKRAFRGPDIFWVGGVTDPDRNRKVWIAWEEEDGRLPDVIVELLSPSTAKKDRTEKRDLYARIFGTAEYFMGDPDRHSVEGLRLAGRSYQPIEPDEKGRLWSQQLGVFFGMWHGIIQGRRYDWVRLFRPDGSLIPTPEERAETEHQQVQAERQRTEAERQRAEAAEAELARLRALLEERGRG
ncbi:MAG TPA: Uma2 family endonuclease [Thermoanaerobaculia bacterium]|nr:Uma2 family endonuclease [Thermoanaerobaculia bacterium]